MFARARIAVANRFLFREEKRSAFPQPMSRMRITFAILSAGMWLSLAATSFAQIAADVDEHGKLVYSNENSLEVRHRSTISSLPLAAEQSATKEKLAERPSTFMPMRQLGQPSDRLDRIVQQAAERNKLDPALVKAVISTESGWNPQAVSQKGAMGLMQLIPATAQRFGVGNPYDPAQNVEGGTKYLRTLIDRYDGDLTKSLAAYNSGEHAVDQSGGVPAYRETQRYVQRVSDAYFRPDSGRISTQWSPPRPPVRKEVDSNGRVVFTNE